MSYLKLQHNGLSYPVRTYGGLNNLRRTMARNDDSFESWLNLANRTIRNQNPLVLLLQQFSVNVEWSLDYLINVIDFQAQSAASILNITSLYNRGKDHPLSVYPETNHRTLLVLPFGKPDRVQINGYADNELNTLVPFYPIFTTDTNQRWDLMEIIDTQERKASHPINTIIQIDIYALVIGYWRWLKSNREYGNSPHAYIANFPMMNCYLYHNELVNFNYLNEHHENIEVRKGGFTIEAYATELKYYTKFKNENMSNEPMKSFTEFYQINAGVNISVDLSKMIFPQVYKSLSFSQMSWVWSLASLGMVQRYMMYKKATGAVDGQIDSQLRDYFLNSYQAQANQIKDQNWQVLFHQLWHDTKTFVKVNE